MNPKIIFIAIMILIVLGVGGFFVSQNIFQIEKDGSVEEFQTLGEEEITPDEGEIFPSGEGGGAPTKADAPAETPGTETPKTETPEVKNTNPVDDLSDALVASRGADCRSEGNASAIAECLLDWQENNIFWCYTNPEAINYFDYFSPGYPDCVVDMQFQQMSPGLFPVSKVMTLKIRDGKIFGACYTYATTYCALARWHGLTCRVMEAKTTISFYSASSGDYATGYCGSAPQNFLDKLGQNCADWRTKNWLMDADHYWAEVLIQGNWQIMERPTWAYRRDTTKYIIQAGRSYADTGW